MNPLNRVLKYVRVVCSLMLHKITMSSFLALLTDILTNVTLKRSFVNFRVATYLEFLHLLVLLMDCKGVVELVINVNLFNSMKNMRTQISKLLELGVVEKSQDSEWSQVHPVPKGNGSWRLTIDIVQLNAATKGLAYSKHIRNTHAVRHYETYMLRSTRYAFRAAAECYVRFFT